MISGLYLCLSLLAVFGITASFLGPNLFTILFVTLPSLVPFSPFRLRHSCTCGTISYVKCVVLLLLLTYLRKEVMELRLSGRILIVFCNLKSVYRNS